MRLIDADLLTEEIKSLRCTLIGLRAGKGIPARAADEYQKSILQIIEQQPTAFDKEKVIAQIKEESHAENLEWTGTSGEVYYHYLEKIIEEEEVLRIVEKGGIE